MEFHGYLDECDLDLQRCGLCFPCVHDLEGRIHVGWVGMEFRGFCVASVCDLQRSRGK
jgi:hypothetical protein